jgi:hypothetical protein
MNCQYCEKVFAYKGTLVNHQKTAKYCLEMQGKNVILFDCQYCRKNFTSQQNLKEHTSICKEKEKLNEQQKRQEYEDTLNKIKQDCANKLDEKDSYYQEKFREKNEYIVKLELNITKLEAKLEKFENAVVTNMAATTHALEAKSAKALQAASTTTNNTTTNITVNNFLNLSQEHMKKVLSERLNYNVVYAGQAGLATFVFDNILKDSTGKLIYRCVDASRQMFEFVDENGETVRDMKAEKLTQSLLKGDVIRLGLEAAAVGWNTENEKLNTERVGVFGQKVNEYADLNRNNTVFRAKVSSLTT